MKKIILIVTLLLSIGNILAQSPKFDWVTQEGNAQIDDATTIRRASNGDLYVLMYFTVSTNIGTINYQQLGASNAGDIVLCKYNSAGVYQWAKHIYASGNISQFASIEIDGSDNLYFLTTFDGTLTFDGTNYFAHQPSLPFQYPSGVFATKISSAGNVSWAKILSKEFGGGRPAMAVSNLGELIYMNYSSDSVIVNNTIDRFLGSVRTYYISYHTDGTFNWYQMGEINVNSAPIIKSLRFDNAGNLYGAGTFFGSHTFMDNTTISSNGGTDVFLFKMNLNFFSSWSWGKSFGSSGNDEMEGMEVDANGNVILLTSLSANTNVEGINVLVPNKMTALVKYNSSGNSVLVNPIINSQTYRPFGGSDLRRDLVGNLYASGYFTNTLTINNSTISPLGASDALLIKIDKSSYNPVWVKQFGGNGDDNVSAIPYNDNELYCAGFFSGITTFGSFTKTALGRLDPFIAKLSGCDFPTVNVSYNGNTTLCNGQSLLLNATQLSGGNYQWLKNTTPLPSQTSNSFTASSSGVYSVDIDLGGICRDTFGAVNVNVSNINATIQSAKSSICQGGVMQLSTTLPYSSYSWSTGVNSPTASVNQQGTYFVTVIDGSGCKDTANIIIGQYPQPNAPSILNGSNCLLASSIIINGYSYKWKLNGNVVGTNSPYLDAKIEGSGFYTLEITDANGCKANSTSPLSVSCPTGIDNYRESNKISIFPNPNTGKFKIVFETAKQADIKINMYDMLGQLVQEETQTKSQGVFSKEINTGNLAKGIYILQLKVGEEIMNKRIEIE